MSASPGMMNPIASASPQVLTESLMSSLLVHANGGGRHRNLFSRNAKNARRGSSANRAASVANRSQALKATGTASETADPPSRRRFARFGSLHGTTRWVGHPKHEFPAKAIQALT
ncbi:hypothetical protein [Methylobacterium thuringiense]|uniref:hypothetical protein n=1 Tax=Methylobacterium thuringiense TaxID=1003091 RepID=UPI001EDE73D2|nr:hypothetical protein [Methylobacterium thuringiense]